VETHTEEVEGDAFRLHQGENQSVHPTAALPRALQTVYSDPRLSTPHMCANRPCRIARFCLDQGAHTVSDLRPLAIHSFSQYAQQSRDLLTDETDVCTSRSIFLSATQALLWSYAEEQKRGRGSREG